MSGDTRTSAAAPADKDAEPKSRPSVVDVAPSPWRPIAALAAIGCALAGFFALGLDAYVHPDTLREYDAQLRAWADAGGALFVLAYMGTLITVALACLPAVAFMSVLGGFLFGPLAGAVYAYTAALIAAILAYFGARYAFRATVIRRGGAMLVRMEDAFERNAVLVLLLIRLLPVVPFWAANAIPAVLGVPLGAFVVATALGIVPGSVLLPNLGHGIAEVVASGEDYDASMLANPHILIPVVALSSIVLGVLVWRGFARVRGHQRGAR